jgi:hypothetical protein
MYNNTKPLRVCDTTKVKGHNNNNNNNNNNNTNKQTNNIHKLKEV